ncbi:MAG: hypothetical protein WCT11_04920 [Candidatus Magasanikbacteria bacterium]|jgi:hypothetical protein
MQNLKQVLVQKINKTNWWHVPPTDPKAYKKRGKFLASTYDEANFYGKPNLLSEKVIVVNPLFGFSEMSILKKLFGSEKAKWLLKKTENLENYKVRIGLDAKIYHRAKRLGYDSVVLMTKKGREYLKKGLKPRSIELNIFL